MHIQARPYGDATDLARMRRLVMDGTRANIRGSYMHPGCLDWATQNPPDEPANRQNIRLWERVDGVAVDLVAWAITLRHEKTFDLFVHPEIFGTAQHEAIVDEYLVWAESLSRERGIRQLWPWWLMEYDETTLRLLMARGFALQPSSNPPPLFERALDALPKVVLPDGFTMGGVHGLNDGRARAAVTYAAFGVTSNWEHYAADYARFMNSPMYDGERDVLVRSPDGRGAAACTIWFDPVNAIGLFEPVATHPDFQGRGLGKAAMVEGLRRMKSAGMTRAILGFDPNNIAARRLYETIGFSASAYFAVCFKDVLHR